MNRPGQPPQRPPNLGQTQVMGGGPFRGGPFLGAAYGMPPRNAAAGLQQQGFPGMPTNHRTAGGTMVQPTPGFMQQRTAGAYPFGGTTMAQQQQQHQAHQQHSLQQLGQQQQQQQQQGTVGTTGGAGSLPPHLQGLAGAPGLGTAQSGSSTSEAAALDPNDFPALGSTSAAAGNGNGNGTGAANNTSSPVTTLASSYASQAGTGLTPASASSGSQGQGGSGSQARDFTADDFPALGGQSNPTQTSNSTSAQDASHPPGLNGLSSQQGDQHRQNMLGALQGSAQHPTPGVLNLSAQQRGLQQPSLDGDKRNPTSKVAPTSNHATWNSSSSNQVFPSGQQNGTTQTTNHLQQQQQLAAPPGVPPPSSFANQQAPYSTTDGPVGSATQSSATLAAPTTPAQQILMSPADRWGLLGLLAMIKSSDVDQTLLSIGTDLGTMGLDMQNSSNLFSTFITPWSDSSAAHSVEPDFTLPACYNVQPPAPGPGKVSNFSEETLFFMFYAHPRDALQEVAAQELWSRNWRYSKELRLWIANESGHAQQSKPIENGRGEQGHFTFWDPDNWEKGRKEFTVMYADLEDKSTRAFAAPTLTLQTNSAAQANATSTSTTSAVTTTGASASTSQTISQAQMSSQRPFQAIGGVAVASL